MLRPYICSAFALATAQLGTRIGVCNDSIDDWLAQGVSKTRR
jgi:hypothetical protein